MNTSASRKIESLTQNVNTFPREVSVWNKLMSECIKLKVQMTKCQLTSLLFNKLKQKNIGTPAIEKYVRNEVRMPKYHDRVRSRLLKFKIENLSIEKEIVKAKYVNKYAYIVRRWGQYRSIFSQFNIIMQSEVESTWKAGRQKIKNKIEFLSKKRSNPDLVSGEWNGILISDDKLKSRYEEPVIEPLNYGNIQLSDNEKKVLTLPPKFTTFENISREKMEVAAEVMVDKLRWEDRSRKQRDNGTWTEDWEWDQVQNKTVYDESKKSLDFAKQRHCDHLLSQISI